MHHFAESSHARRVKLVTFATLVTAFPFLVAATSASASPSISGKPAASVIAGHTYTFTPEATGPAGEALSFSIAHKPAWASFSIATGKLDGTPTSRQTGTYADILISVSDGKSKATLTAFSIDVRSYKEPTISGTPMQAVVAGESYSFTPKATTESGLKPTFAISYKPKWASFNTATGQLHGTPVAADAGPDDGISITVSDGTSTAALPKFDITVMPAGTKSATLSWKAPTENANGTALTDLAGYRIRYGTNPNDLTNTITVNTVARTTEVVSNLSSGTYYFAIMAFNTAGVESKLSNVVSAKF
jgi:hypothetical protein